MFRRILIANRGEIACRIIDTARRLGVETVAVYSDTDRAARHVEMADRAVHIGGSAPGESYLRADAIIRAALDTGAQAIHPGYGFLSENPDFVEAVEAAGLVFIGPSAGAIRAMGLKDAAKRLMERAGVPVVPGYHGDDQDGGRLLERAGKIGFPVLIKAVAGGGGKGMRRVDRAADFAEALASARAEAAGAFGNDAVLVEKFIEKPRHIEVQVFGDGDRAVHLYERDCSLQRRHQKVIEEAPAPGMTEDMRAAMGDAAVRAARAIGYSGAGTVEFIVDAAGGLSADRFWFMEMNTRLQVEHPVSEAITGIDLVEWQLRVAAGEPLPARQQDISCTGHAIEARLYAEDVPKGFLPATGTLKHLRFPDGVRADTGVRQGDVISPFYDPMIAKIITHGATRELALAKLSAALARTEVAGTVTNLAFLGRLVREDDFATGNVDTGLIDRRLDALCAQDAASDVDIAAAAVLAAGLDAPPAPARGFALWEPMAQSVTLCDGACPITARLRHEGAERLVVTVTRAAGAAQAAPPEAGPQDPIAFHWRASGWVGPDGAALRGRRIGDAVVVFSREAREFALVDPLAVAGGEGGSGDLVEAPMPGLVKAIFAGPGQAVSTGDRLALLEAMKMEHTLRAARDGTVAEVFVAAGDQVEAGAALIRLEETP